MKAALISVIGLSFATSAFAQTWATAYEAGLSAGRAQRWQEAEAAFRQAASARTEDSASATTLPGPVTERRQWRGGAPYSPNFLAAYSRYRAALAAKEGSEEQLDGLKAAAAAFSALVDANQAAPETVSLGADAYNRLGQIEARNALLTKAAASRRVWRVDNELLAPEEIARANSSSTAPIQGGNQSGNTTNTVVAQDPGNPIAANTGSGSGAAMPNQPVLTIPTKYALIVGNGDNRLPDSVIPFAVDDSQRVKDALINFSGYDPRNVTVLTNVTAEEIARAAKELSDRMPEGAIVFLYFTGAGAVVDRRDYLAGVDAENPKNTDSMIAKRELYRYFVQKGARIFSFFQVPRLIQGGEYFGRDIPELGSIASMQSTLPGDGISYAILDGKPVGIFTQAVVGVMDDQRSNRIPITEFGWQVFYKVRRGNTGSTGGAGRQTPTLPLLRFLASDARF